MLLLIPPPAVALPGLLHVVLGLGIYTLSFNNTNTQLISVPCSCEVVRGGLKYRWIFVYIVSVSGQHILAFNYWIPILPLGR